MKDPALSTARVLWGSILTSVALMFVALRLAEHPSTPSEPSLFPLLALVALSVAVASFVVPPMLHRQAARALSLETRDAPNTVTAESPSTMRRVFADPEGARATARRLYQSTFIVSLALSEAVAIFGFALGFLGFPEDRALPFFAAGFVLVLVRFPKAGAAEKQLEMSTGARFP